MEHKNDHTMEIVTNAMEYLFKQIIPDDKISELTKQIVSIVEFDDKVSENTPGLKDFVNMQVVHILWDEFCNVPMEPKSKCIEEDWIRFKKGTFREDIWDWFEDMFGVSVYDLLHQADTDTKTMLSKSSEENDQADKENTIKKVPIETDEMEASVNLLKGFGISENEIRYAVCNDCSYYNRKNSICFENQYENISVSSSYQACVLCNSIEVYNLYYCSNLICSVFISEHAFNRLTSILSLAIASREKAYQAAILYIIKFIAYHEKNVGKNINVIEEVIKRENYDKSKWSMPQLFKLLYS